MQFPFSFWENLNQEGIYMEDLLQVGAIANTHGVRGEVKVFPMTDDAGRFRKLKHVILDTGTKKKELEITQVKFFKNLVILKFRGYDTMNEVEPLKGMPLYVTRENAVECGEDEYFIADLIGISVVDEQEKSLGEIKDVLSTGANDVYVIEKPGGGELLLPAIKECVLQVDIKGRRMQVHVLEGL